MPAKSSGGSSTAQLNYVIAARDAQFQRVTKRIIDRLDRLERSGKKVAKSVSGFQLLLRNMPGITALANTAFATFDRTLGRLNRAFEVSIARLDQIGKRARNIDLDTDTVQLWSQAAKEAGVNVDAFQRGLYNVNKVIGEAADGTKEYLDTFERLGVNIRDAQGRLRSMKDIVLSFTTALNNLETAQQQLTVEEFFGRGGKDMRFFLTDFHNQVAQVREGFTGASASAVLLGEELQNMRDRSVGNLTAAFDELLVRLDKFTNFSQSYSRLQMSLARMARSVTETLEDPEFLRGIDLIAEGLGGQRTGLRDRMYGAHPRQGMTGLINRSVGVEAADRDRRVLDRRAIRGGEHYWRAIHEDTLRAQAEAERLAELEARRQEEARNRISNMMELERGAGMMGTMYWAERGRAAMAAQQEAKTLADLREQLFEDEQARLDALKRDREDAHRHQLLLERIQYETARENLQAVIGDFIQSTNDLGSALTRLLDTLASKIINNFAGNIADRLLNSEGGGFLTSIFGNLFGSQRGGAVQRGRAILVGEGGPEVFVPRTSGHIIPNPIASMSASSPVVNLMFNIQSTDGPGVREALKVAEPRLTAAALSAVAVQQSRPGSVLSRQNRLV